MTDYILDADHQKISVHNPLNLDKIEATLRHWYEIYKAGNLDEHDAKSSIRFDGTMVFVLWDNFIEDETTRYIGSITDLACVFGDNPTSTVAEFLQNEF